MAATKKKFTVPSLEVLDEEIQDPRPKALFNSYKTSSKGVERSKDGTNSTTSNAGDPREENNCLEKSEQSKNGANQGSFSKESLHPSRNKVEGTAANSSASSIKPTVGKTFRETFAFLEETSHFKETVAKIKEKE